MGAERRSPRLEMESIVRVLSSRSSAVPLQRRSPLSENFIERDGNAGALFIIGNQREQCAFGAAPATSSNSAATRNLSLARFSKIGSFNELIGYAAHRRNDDDHGVFARGVPDDLRDTRDTGSVTHRCAAKLHYSQEFIHFHRVGAKQFEVLGAKNNRLSGRPRLKKLYTIGTDLREWRSVGPIRRLQCA